MRSLHACDSIISFVHSLRREQSVVVANKEARMNTKLHLLDDVLFVVALFAPVSVILSGALALVAIG
jgi:uncharacterized membrane-anchored protein